MSVFSKNKYIYLFDTTKNSLNTNNILEDIINLSKKYFYIDSYKTMSKNGEIINFQIMEKISRIRIILFFICFYGTIQSVDEKIILQGNFGYKLEVRIVLGCLLVAALIILVPALSSDIYYIFVGLGICGILSIIGLISAAYNRYTKKDIIDMLERLSLTYK